MDFSEASATPPPSAGKCLSWPNTIRKVSTWELPPDYGSISPSMCSPENSTAYQEEYGMNAGCYIKRGMKDLGLGIEE